MPIKVMSYSLSIKAIMREVFATMKGKVYE